MTCAAISRIPIFLKDYFLRREGYIPMAASAVASEPLPRHHKAEMFFGTQHMKFAVRAFLIALVLAKMSFGRFIAASILPVLLWPLFLFIIRRKAKVSAQ